MLGSFTNNASFSNNLRSNLISHLLFQEILGLSSIMCLFPSYVCDCAMCNLFCLFCTLTCSVCSLSHTRKVEHERSGRYLDMYCWAYFLKGFGTLDYWRGIKNYVPCGYRPELIKSKLLPEVGIGFLIWIDSGSLMSTTTASDVKNVLKTDAACSKKKIMSQLCPIIIAKIY